MSLRSLQSTTEPSGQQVENNLSHHSSGITVNLAKFQCVVFTIVLNERNGLFSSCLLTYTNTTKFIILGVLSERTIIVRAIVQLLLGKELHRFKFNMLME